MTNSRNPLIRKIVTLALGSAATVGMSLLGVGATAASAANGVQPVTFDIGAGSLALAQTPSTAIALVPGTATAMPVTTVTDGRNDFARTGAWSATNVVSNLDETGGGQIPASSIAVAQATASFTAGSGTATGSSPGSIVVTGDSIDSVYTYTPTANLTVPGHPNSGSYTGTVTQTLV
jgi:hypothetical protein